MSEQKMLKECALKIVNEFGGITLAVLKDLDEDVINVALMKSPESIQFIKDPTDEQIDLALKFDDTGYTLQFTPWRDLQSQRDAVANCGIAIRYVKDPDLDLQLAAICDDSTSLEYIKNPYPEVVEKAVQMDGFCIRYVENPSDDLKMIALRENPYAIQFIENPTEEMISFVLDKEPSALFNISNLRNNEVVKNVITQRVLSLKCQLNQQNK